MFLHRIRIQSLEPDVGGGTDEEAGEAPGGHGDGGSLREVGEGQHDPFLHQSLLGLLVEVVEHLSKSHR